MVVDRPTKLNIVAIDLSSSYFGDRDTDVLPVVTRNSSCLCGCEICTRGHQNTFVDARNSAPTTFTRRGLNNRRTGESTNFLAQQCLIVSSTLDISQ